MRVEYIVQDTVVASLTISAPSFGGDSADKFAPLLRQFAAICRPPRGVPILFRGRAHNPIYANSDGLATGCSWTDSGDGGGVGQIVLAPVVQPDARIRVGVKVAVAKDEKTAWVTVESNPTSMLLGDNIHPAAFVNPKTGANVVDPSSHWDAMTDTYRLGFEFVELVGGNLFDEKTKLAIERGDIHLVRVQWAATKAVELVPQFLQLMTVVYDQTIARGSGIISNATLSVVSAPGTV